MKNIRKLAKRSRLRQTNLFTCNCKITTNKMFQTRYFWSLNSSQVAHRAGAYPGFCSVKRLRVFLLPTGWDASPSQGYPPALSSPVPIYTRGWRGALFVRVVSCPRTQHNVPGQGSNLDRSLGSWALNFAYLNFNNNAYYSFAEDIFEKFALQCCKLMKIIVKCNMYQPPREIKGRMTLMYYNQSLPNSCKVFE